jgi:hypothetical protein
MQHGRFAHCAITQHNNLHSIVPLNCFAHECRPGLAETNFELFHLKLLLAVAAFLRKGGAAR